MSDPEITPQASPVLGTPWVPLWPLAPLGDAVTDFAKSVTDWNLAITNGWYIGNANIPNSPIAGLSFFGMVTSAGGGAVTQLLWEYARGAGEPQRYYERYCIGGSWGAWKLLNLRVGYGTTLPVDPIDGLEHTLVDAASAPNSTGFCWRFRYNGNHTGPSKWEFIGGAPAIVSIDAEEATGSASYVDLATVGPSFTLPYQGYWLIEHQVKLRTGYGFASYSLPSVAVQDDWARRLRGRRAVGAVPRDGLQEVGGLGAGAVTMKYKSLGGTTYFQQRRLAITPVRIGP